MSRSQIAVDRRSLREWVTSLRNAEWQCRWWFNVRHRWSADHGGYDHCRRCFNNYRRTVHSIRRYLARAAERLVAHYKT